MSPAARWRLIVWLRIGSTINLSVCGACFAERAMEREIAKKESIYFSAEPWPRFWNCFPGADCFGFSVSGTDRRGR